MTFIKKLLFNLALLLAIGVVLYLLFPEMMGQVFQLYGAVFGPAAILLLITSAPGGKIGKTRRFSNL